MTRVPNMPTSPGLNPLPSWFVRGRRSLHQVAFFAVAPKRYQETGRLGLRHTATGFGTPEFGQGEQVRVEDDRIVHQQGNETRSTEVTTLRGACNFLEIPYREVWFDAFHDPLASVGPDTALDVDAAVTRALALWQEFAGSILESARQLGGPDDEVTEIQLWPEHFDQAFEMGSEELGRRASYGASPGDEQHEEPYLYVAPWMKADRSDPFWNDRTFAGATLTYGELADSNQADELALGYFRRGFTLLAV